MQDSIWIKFQMSMDLSWVTHPNLEWYFISLQSMGTFWLKSVFSAVLAEDAVGRVDSAGVHRYVRMVW